MTALTKPETSRLAELETTIRRGERTFLEVGEALREIRDSKLYRESHTRFEDYCQERWDFTERRGRQLLQAAEIGTKVPVGNERQARELARLESEQAREQAWREATDLASGENRSITSSDVRVAVEKRLPTSPPKPSPPEPAKSPPPQPPSSAPGSESPQPRATPSPQSAAERVQDIAAGCRRLSTLVAALDTEAAVREQPENVEEWRAAFGAACDGLAELTERLDREMRQQAEVETTASRAGIGLRR